mgnify:CR=1 FL=1
MGVGGVGLGGLGVGHGLQRNIFIVFQKAKTTITKQEEGKAEEGEEEEEEGEDEDEDKEVSEDVDKEEEVDKEREEEDNDKKEAAETNHIQEVLPLLLCLQRVDWHLGHCSLVLGLLLLLGKGLVLLPQGPGLVNVLVHGLQVGHH